MRNSDYWKQRFVQLEKGQNEIGVSAFSSVEQQYRQAQKEIEGEIAIWYQRFADNNKISLAQSRQWLTGANLKEFKRDVQDYIKYGQEHALSGSWEKGLESVLSKSRISKLEALKIQTQHSLEVMFADQHKMISDTMKKVYINGYYHTAYELQRGINYGWDISGLEQSQIEKIISKPWAADKFNFSQRILNSKQKLIADIQKELTQNLLTGGDPQKAINAIAKKINTSKNNAERLIMTEQAYFSSAAQEKCYEDLGIEQYEIIATLDSHTSDICQNLNGKVFSIKDYEVGVTAPPFHVFCRSTTAPVFDENLELDGKQLPKNISYEEWKQEYVGGGAQDNLQQMAGTSNDWSGADPIKHTEAELEELNRYAEERGIKLYNRQKFDGDISLMKAEIDTIAKIREDFNYTDYLQLGWKPMGIDDFGETSANHQQIWINRLALRNREITESNLAVDNWLATDKAEGIAAHEMGHVLSGKIKNGKTGLDIYKDTVYIISRKQISDDEALDMLNNYISRYSVSGSIKSNGDMVFNEIIPEMLNVYYSSTKPDKYSSEFIRLLKEACKK